MRGLLLATALFALSTTAFAGPPGVGDKMVARSAIICDTKEQALDVFAGSKVDGGKGIDPIYQKYRQMIDPDGEPTCNMQPVAGLVVRSVDDLGESHDAGGDVVHGWLIEIS